MQLHIFCVQGLMKYLYVIRAEATSAKPKNVRNDEDYMNFLIKHIQDTEFLFSCSLSFILPWEGSECGEGIVIQSVIATSFPWHMIFTSQ